MERRINSLVNILLTFGILAISAGILALKPALTTISILGSSLILFGLCVERISHEKWHFLANIFIVLGALMLPAILLKLNYWYLNKYLMTALIYLFFGFLAKSAMLLFFSILMVVAALNNFSYELNLIIIQGTSFIIVVFSLLGLISYIVSKKLQPVYERLCHFYALSAWVIANLGFWIGSVWGDKIYSGRTENIEQQLLEGSANLLIFIPNYVFSIIWGISLLIILWWAITCGKSFLANLSIAFLSIHFYTQYFEYLDTHPIILILAGLIGILVGVGVWYYNEHSQAFISENKKI
jgi:hypothetical protein